MMRVSISGDFCPQLRIYKAIEREDYSFFDEVKKLLIDSDYSIVNLECPIIHSDFKPIDKTGPNLGCETDKAVDCLVKTGFNCVTLANNHFRDYGQDGVDFTIAACKKYGIEYCGGGKDIYEASKVLYKEIDGETLAIINVCEHEWSIATKERSGSAPLDLVDTVLSIEKANNEADYVLVIVHGGVEHYNLPTPRMKKLYRYFIDRGADAVINHHQHCYSGYEEYSGKPILYGLGNFSFDINSPTKKWCEGFMVRLLLNKGTIDYKLIPYTQCTITNPAVHFLHDDRSFNTSIDDLNMIIASDGLLEQNFEVLCKDGLRRFAPILYPYKNRYLRALAIRGLLPPFVSKNRLKYLRAFSSCESYHESLLNFLDNKLLLSDKNRN